jgi:hypothetical protein
MQLVVVDRDELLVAAVAVVGHRLDLMTRTTLATTASSGTLVSISSQRLDAGVAQLTRCTRACRQAR